jgi:magnesium transporter
VLSCSINATKRELMFIRRAVWPQRDALNLLTRGEIKVGLAAAECCFCLVSSHVFVQVVSERVRTYLRDCYDHTIQLAGSFVCSCIVEVVHASHPRLLLADIVESYRELSNNLLNTYLSALGQKTNEIMKFLTIVGAIFIPLTFLAGLCEEPACLCAASGRDAHDVCVFFPCSAQTA